MPGKPVRIAVVFEPGKKARPVWFELNRQQHRIKETTYHWKEQVGAATLLHFAVTDGDDLYELIYNSIDQSWLLNSIEVI